MTASGTLRSGPLVRRQREPKRTIIVDAQIGAMPLEEVADDFTAVVELSDLPDHAGDPGHAIELRRYTRCGR